jgi:thiamine pyrophosphokinase
MLNRAAAYRLVVGDLDSTAKMLIQKLQESSKAARP